MRASVLPIDIAGGRRKMQTLRKRESMCIEVVMVHSITQTHSCKGEWK